MKNLLLTVLALFLFTGTVSAAEGRFILNLYGSYMDVAANEFTHQASRNKVYLEAKAAYALSGNLYVWASHGSFPVNDAWKSWDSKGSLDPDILIERTLSKRAISLGAGYYIGYFQPGHIAVRAEAGLCHISNTIDAAVSSVASGAFIRSLESRQRALGGRATLAVTYGLLRSVFAELTAGYLFASDKTDGVRSSLGGFHAALGLGIQL